MQWIIVGNGPGRALVVGGENPDAIGPEFSGHTHAELRVRDAAREVHVYGSFKIVRTLLEEGTLLRKKYFEALVDRVLRLITFKLSKIWIDGEVEDETVFQDEFAVEAGDVRRDFCR